MIREPTSPSIRNSHAPYPALNKRVFITFTLMSEDTWFVTANRALYCDESGGCWVELTRLREIEEIGRCVEELDCGYYGPEEPPSPFIPF